MKHPEAKPVHLSKAYGSPTPLSTDRVPPVTWNTLRFALAVVISMVGLGVSLSLAGFGNPTHGWPMSETPPLVAAGQRDGYRLWQLSPAPTPPFLIEVSLNEPASTYWGLWLAGSAGAEQQLLVDPQGFISCGPQVDWRPFIHAHAGANRLSLQVEPDGQLVWRVNDEIAWAGQEMLPSRIGIAVPTDHALDDIEVTFYERP